MPASALLGTVNHARNPPSTLPTLHTYSDNTATAKATVSNEQLMALFEKPATAKRFVDTCYSSLFYKRTPRHVENPLSFQVSSRAKQYQTKSPARSANSPRKAISFQDAPEPEGRRRVNYRTPPQAPSGRGARPRSGRFFIQLYSLEEEFEQAIEN